VAGWPGTPAAIAAPATPSSAVVWRSSRRVGRMTPHPDCVRVRKPVNVLSARIGRAQGVAFALKRPFRPSRCTRSTSDQLLFLPELRYCEGIMVADARWIFHGCFRYSGSVRAEVSDQWVLNTTSTDSTQPSPSERATAAAGTCPGGRPRSTWTSPPDRARRMSCADCSRRHPRCTRRG
jgi:hypothetical protein